jgi:hypothetical protein
MKSFSRKSKLFFISCIVILVIILTVKNLSYKEDAGIGCYFVNAESARITIASLPFDLYLTFGFLPPLHAIIRHDTTTDSYQPIKYDTIKITAVYEIYCNNFHANNKLFGMVESFTFSPEQFETFCKSCPFNQLFPKEITFRMKHFGKQGLTIESTEYQSDIPFIVDGSFSTCDDSVRLYTRFQIQLSGSAIVYQGDIAHKIVSKTINLHTNSRYIGHFKICEDY